MVTLRQISMVCIGAINAYCLFFNISLHIITIQNRHDTTLPFTYTIIMAINGSICNIAMLFTTISVSILSEQAYETYLTVFGKTVTLFINLIYFIPLILSVIMSINRVYIVIRPFDQKLFSQFRIFIYSIIMMVVVISAHLIPYFSNCYVLYSAVTNAFGTACSPNRHPITKFFNTYAICAPIITLTLNIGIVMHLKLKRLSFYAKVSQLLFGIKTAQGSILTTEMSRTRRKREYNMMRQTIGFAIFLSFYEIGGFLIKLFPDIYAKMSSGEKDAFFYLRILSINMINILVYFIQSSATRKLLFKFWGFEKNTQIVSITL